MSGCRRPKEERVLAGKLRRAGMRIIDISRRIGAKANTISYWLKRDGVERHKVKEVKFIDNKPKFQIVEINSLKLKLVDGKPWKWSGEWINTTITAAVVRAQMEEDRVNGEMKFWYEKRDL